MKNNNEQTCIVYVGNAHVQNNSTEIRFVIANRTIASSLDLEDIINEILQFN